MRSAPLQSALGKARRRIIRFLFFLYIVAYLDRVNVGFGALDMNRDLGFSAAVYPRLNMAIAPPKVGLLVTSPNVGPPKP
jgi:hypothetical protein